MSIQSGMLAEHGSQVRTKKVTKMTIKSLLLATSLLVCASCSDQYLVQTNAPSERAYAVKRCSELGVNEGDANYEKCLEEKGIARWALKNCNGPLNSVSTWYPTLCNHQYDD
jgi:hypothetical protein